MKIDDHNLLINGEGFYAQAINVDIPFRRRERIEVDIMNGLPIYYKKKWRLKHMTFQTILYGDEAEVREYLEQFEKNICVIESPYIGTIKSFVIIQIEHADGTPETNYCKFEVQEVAGEVGG